MTIGTMMLSDLLEGQASLQTVASYGLDRLIPIVQADFAAHNAVIQDIATDIASPTSERLESSGVADTKQMFTADEYSRVPTQKVIIGQNGGYPLDKQQISMAWTSEWFRMHTVADLAKEIIAIQKAHLFRMYRELRRALWLSTDYTWQEKYQTPFIAIPVKRLYNADGWGIPTGPHGEAFDGATHNHYMANATLTGAAVLATINTVLEHYPTASLWVAIAQADRTAWEAPITGYTPYPDPRLSVNMSAAVPLQKGQPFDMNNIAIGMLGAAEVWVKPWAISNYPCVYMKQGPKPLKYRQRPGMEGLVLVAQNDAFPLHVEYSEAHFGFGVDPNNRGSAAILFVGGGSYVDPTIS